MSKYILFTLCLIGILSNCQYPVDSSKLPEPQRFLIIDAQLNQAFGRVNVAWTLTDVTPQGAYITPVPPQATAYIQDSQGNVHEFSTDGTPDYSFQGQPGETYQLFVQVEGQMYESAPETMRVCPAIDSITPNYFRETFRAPVDQLYDGFDVYAHFQDRPGEEGYYQWDWVHYERTFTCNRVTIGTQLYRVPCTPYDCWGIYRNSRVIVQSDKLRDGTAFAHKIVRVPFAQPPAKYYLRVEQRAITPSVYTYLKSQETQTQNTGSIFDVPAQTQFSPNVHNTANPSEKILGVFSVYSSRYQIIYIDMQQQIDGAQVKYNTDPTPLIPDPLAQAPCTESSTRTQTRPEGWVD